jgi:hypothetical protein
MLWAASSDHLCLMDLERTNAELRAEIIIGGETPFGTRRRKNS